MNATKLTLDYARDVVHQRLARFTQLAHLSTDLQEPNNADIADLGSAARRSLAALKLFAAYCPEHSAPMFENRLRKAFTIARGIVEVRFLAGLLQNDGCTAGVGRDSVNARAELRLSRYSLQLAKLRQRMVVERFTDKTNRFIENMKWVSDSPEPKLVELAKVSVFDAQCEIGLATDLDTSDLTIVHEFWSGLQELSDIMEVFHDVISHDEWESLSDDIGDLQHRMRPVIKCSSAKMRCTSWLERARGPQEIATLRSLITVAREQSELYYGRLASSWNGERASDLRAKFERVLGMSSASL